MASELASPVTILPESPPPVPSSSSSSFDEGLLEKKESEGEETVTTHIVTPSSVELEESVESLTLSPTQAYARHIQSTSAHSQASARKAELEELRSRNLAKNRKKGISDNARNVPFSSTEVENFFLNQKKQGQEWRKKQRETYESLHSYRNDEIQAQAKRGDKNFYHRDIPNRTKAGAYTMISEYDRFFQQQRAANEHHRKQHADSLSYLHNYRHQHTAGEGDLGDSSSDVASYVMPGEASVEVMFGDILARMRADLLEAKTCPLPESPPSEPCLEPAGAEEAEEIPLYNATSENVFEAVEVTEDSSVKQIEEETAPVKSDDEIATNSDNDPKEDKLGEIGDLIIPDMAPSPSVESDSEGSSDETKDICGLDTDLDNQDQTEKHTQEATPEVLLENVGANEIEGTETEIDEEKSKEIHEENGDDQDPSTEEDALESYSKVTEDSADVDDVDIKENEVVLGNEDQRLEEPSTEEDIIESIEDETEGIAGDDITVPQDDAEFLPVENVDHEQTESEVVENVTVKASEEDVPDLIDDEDEKEDHESIDKETKKDKSEIELDATPTLPDTAIDDESKEDETDLLLDDILLDDSAEIEDNEPQLIQEVESLKKDITEASDSQTNGEVTASIPVDDDDAALDSLLDDEEDASKDVSTENPEEFTNVLAVPSPSSIKKSPKNRQKSGVETSEKGGKRRTPKTPRTPKARDSTAVRKSVTFSPLATKLSSPSKKNKEESSPGYMRQTRARSSSPWKRRPTIKPRRASLTPRATNSSDPSKRLGFNIGSTRGLIPELKQPSCSSTWIPDVHQSRSGCSRCLKLASQEERDKYEARGHHHRINQTRGGCYRSCQFFPKNPCDAPVRLCRKCFYTTHDTKTRSKRG